jgi:hypothetical protein
MLKPRKTIPQNAVLWGLVALFVLAGVVALVAAFGGGSAAEDEVNAIYTNAAATLEAQQMTLEASQPTETPTPAATPTTALTNTPFTTPTVLLQPLLASPTTSFSGGGGAVGCDNSIYVADVTIQDGTQMAPGQTFTKTWRLQNTGTCPWTTAYKVTFLSGNAMGGQATALTTTVNPGQNGDVSVAMTAPTTPGAAIGHWRLANASGQQFGTSFYVEIMVGGATGPTATPTVTTGAPAATATFTQTATATMTETPVTQP